MDLFKKDPIRLELKTNEHIHVILWLKYTIPKIQNFMYFSLSIVFCGFYQKSTHENFYWDLQTTLVTLQRILHIHIVVERELWGGPCGGYHPGQLSNNFQNITMVIKLAAGWWIRHFVTHPVIQNSNENSLIISVSQQFLGWVFPSPNG